MDHDKLGPKDLGSLYLSADSPPILIYYFKD